jgi:hypothetical protein
VATLKPSSKLDLMSSSSLSGKLSA